MKVTAPWGSIVLSMSQPPTGSVITGQGWTLQLSGGYGIVSDPRKTGSYVSSH